MMLKKRLEKMKMPKRMAEEEMDLAELEMPEAEDEAEEGEEMSEEMDMESEPMEMEESPAAMSLADASDEELLAEIKKRGLSAMMSEEESMS